MPYRDLSFWKDETGHTLLLSGDPPIQVPLTFEQLVQLNRQTGKWLVELAEREAGRRGLALGLTVKEIEWNEANKGGA